MQFNTVGRMHTSSKLGLLGRDLFKINDYKRSATLNASLFFCLRFFVCFVLHTFLCPLLMPPLCTEVAALTCPHNNKRHSKQIAQQKEEHTENYHNTTRT